MLELLLSFTMWLHNVYSFFFFRSFRSSDPLLCLNRLKWLRCLACYRVLQIDLNKSGRLNLDIFRDFLLVLLLDIGFNQTRRSELLKRYIYNFLFFLWCRYWLGGLNFRGLNSANWLLQRVIASLKLYGFCF